MSNPPEEKVKNLGEFGDRPPMPPEVQAYYKFQIAEAKWIDSVIIGRFIPLWYTKWIKRMTVGRTRIIGNLVMWFVDEIWLARIVRVRITRNSDKTMLNGAKGYRQGMDHGVRLDRIRTTVLKGGKEIAKQVFPIGVIIK